MPAVGESRDRDAEYRIDNREGRSIEEAQLRVADPQTRFDILRQDRDDLAIGKVADVDDEQYREYVPRIHVSHVILAANLQVPQPAREWNHLPDENAGATVARSMPAFPASVS